MPDGNDEFPAPEFNFEQHGPKFKAMCPYAHCGQVYHGYTQKGVDALMSMHIDDHTRGVFSKPKKPEALTVEDIKFLAALNVKWPDDE